MTTLLLDPATCSPALRQYLRENNLIPWPTKPEAVDQGNRSLRLAAVTVTPFTEMPVQPQVPHAYSQPAAARDDDLVSHGEQASRMVWMSA